jgi:hypothetical protein
MPRRHSVGRLDGGFYVGRLTAEYLKNLLLAAGIDGGADILTRLLLMMYQAQLSGEIGEATDITV